MANLYTNHALLRNLESHSLGAYGTFRSNRRGILDDFRERVKSTRPWMNTVLALKWKDKNDATAEYHSWWQYSGKVTTNRNGKGLVGVYQKALHGGGICMSGVEHNLEHRSNWLVFGICTVGLESCAFSVNGPVRMEKLLFKCKWVRVVLWLERIRYSSYHHTTALKVTGLLCWGLPPSQDTT